MTDDGSERYADLMQRLPALHDGLRSAESVGELLARASELARVECRYGRAVVVALRDGRLVPDATDALPDPDSDLLRRRILATPVELVAGTLEAELVRRPSESPEHATELPSELGERFGLDAPAFGVVAPEDTAVGLLVLDGPSGSPVGRTMVPLFARMLAVVLEHTVLQARIAELSAELRYMTVSARALAAEAFEGPITLPVRGRHLPTFRGLDDLAARSAEEARAKLTERETRIAELLARGRSNREIAGQLFISTETVKDNVARVMRKLGAANRVEAAVRFLGLAEVPPNGGR